MKQNRHRASSDYPVMQIYDPNDDRYRRCRVHRFIANLFWDVPVFSEYEGGDYQIHQQCGTSNCVNPRHFKPVYSHQSQRGGLFPERIRDGRYEP